MRSKQLIGVAAALAVLCVLAGAVYAYDHGRRDKIAKGASFDDIVKEWRSNGGETIRIGTSDESLSASNTIVERNIFEGCDGEVEIVSVKSGGNIVRGNLFLASQGALVLRHGNGNLVERNVFLGKGKANTGGIRVINRDQIVRGNYIEGTRGTSFLSAIAVMNGVPNSKINLYHQVANAVINSSCNDTR